MSGVPTSHQPLGWLASWLASWRLVDLYWQRPRSFVVLAVYLLLHLYCAKPTCSNFFDVVTKFAQKEICQSSLSFPFFSLSLFSSACVCWSGESNARHIYTQQAQNILLKMLGVPQHGLAFVKVPLPTSLERKSPMQPLPRCGGCRRVVPLPPPLLVSKK